MPLFCNTGVGGIALERGPQDQRNRVTYSHSFRGFRRGFKVKIEARRMERAAKIGWFRRSGGGVDARQSRPEAWFLSTDLNLISKGPCASEYVFFLV